MDQKQEKSNPVTQLDEDLKKLKNPVNKGKVTRNRKRKEKLQALLIQNGGETTDEVLSVMRSLDMPKPAHISEIQWENAREHLDTRVKKAIAYTALGLKPAQAARMVGITPVTLKRALTSQAGAKELNRIYDAVIVEEAKKKIDEILPVAIDTAFQIMVNEKTKDSVRMEGAFRFMDRAMGRPTQTVEMTHDLVRRVYQRLDEIRTVRSEVSTSDLKSSNSESTNDSAQVAVASAVVVVEEKKDEIDSWVEENL